MNIIKQATNKEGITWGIIAIKNTFIIAYKEGDTWYLTDYKYSDPDPAIKHFNAYTY